MTNRPTLAVVGAGGRMGLEVTRQAAAKGFSVIAAVEHSSYEHLGRDLGSLAGIHELGVAVTADLASIGSAQVTVDLSLPRATATTLEACAAQERPLVCGTTGVGSDVMEKMREASSRIPVLYTPNLSPGIAVLSHLLEEAIGRLGPAYDVEIVEMHHREKVDSPSGTAAALANTAAACLEIEDANIIHGRRGHVGKRPSKEVGVHAVRGGTVFGEHTVILAGEHERLELTHRASSRALFAVGAIEAARFIANAEPGFYSMKDVFSGRATEAAAGR